MISRRSLVTALALAPLLAAPARAVAATLDAPAARSTGLSGASSAPSALTTLGAAEFGPTGGHWPSRTPRRYDPVDTEIVAACNWRAISSAITTAAATAGTARVLVEPGVLPGYGAGSTRTAVLANIGRAGRASRVLVVPRDGVGSVTTSDSIRIDRVRGVAFAGFWTFPSSMVLTGVQDFAWAWSKGRSFNVTAQSGGNVSDVELVECVTPESLLNDADVWAFRTDRGTMSGMSMQGCYIAPYFKPAGSRAHLDTLQLSGTHSIAGVKITDSVLFGSTNAAFIPTSLASNVLFDHSLVVAGSRMLERYPLPAGANTFTSGWPQASNGSGTRGILSAQNSTLIGSVPGVWASVVASSTTAANTSVQQGKFTCDPSLSTVDAAWIDLRAPYPSDDRLREAWVL